ACRHGVAQLQPVGLLEGHREHPSVAETNHLRADAAAARGSDLAEIADRSCWTARFDQQAHDFRDLARPPEARDGIELPQLGCKPDLHERLRSQSAKPRSIS